MLETHRAGDLVETFERDGFVRLPGFLSPAEVQEVRDNVARYVEHVVPTLPPHRVFYEEVGRPETLKGLRQMAAHDAFFARLFADHRIVGLAEALLNGPVMGKNVQWFDKAPSNNQPTPPHQDGFYFMLKPQNALTMWLALEEVDEENGCIRYIRRSHLGPMRPHRQTNVLGFSQGIADYADADRALEEAMPARAGDLLAHHAMTVHRADGNRSASRTRQALGFIFYGANASEDRQAHEAYQAALFEKLAAAGRI